jgi:hypothetical protein
VTALTVPFEQLGRTACFTHGATVHTSTVPSSNPHETLWLSGENATAVQRPLWFKEVPYSCVPVATSHSFAVWKQDMMNRLSGEYTAASALSYMFLTRGPHPKARWDTSRGMPTQC